MKHYWSLAIVLIIIATSVGCVEPLDEAGIKAERMTKKMHEYGLKRIKQCKEEATEEAEYYVDSLIASWVGHAVMDTISFPDRPTRPTRPADIIGTVPKFDINNTHNTSTPNNN